MHTEKNQVEKKSTNSLKTPTDDTDFKMKNRDKIDRAVETVGDHNMFPVDEKVASKSKIEGNTVESGKDFNAWLAKNPDSNVISRDAFAHALNIGIPYEVANALFLRSSENAKVIAQLK